MSCMNEFYAFVTRNSKPLIPSVAEQIPCAHLVVRMSMPCIQNLKVRKKIKLHLLLHSLNLPSHDLLLLFLLLFLVR